tara:strand:+ start:333 stop:1466 length:1134 start_codon:yes stop_codon:yes gene_type:complete
MINKEKILLTANTSWFLYNFFKNIIKDLIARNYQIICAAPRDKYSQKLISLGCDYRELNFNQKSTNPLSELKTLAKFFFLIREINPSLAINFTIKNNIYGSISSAVLGIKSIAFITGLGTAFIGNRSIKYIAKFLYKIAMRSPKAIFCLNEDDFNYLKDEKIVKSEKLILLMGLGVDKDKFNPDKKIKIFGKKRFLYVGRMLKDKGIHELIGSFKKLTKEFSNVELILTGPIDSINSTAISKKEIEDWTCHPNIDYRGNVEDISEIYAVADYLILPSYREGLPAVLLEASMMEICILASDVPGCREVIEDGYNGLLFKPRNVESLFLALKKALKLSSREKEYLEKNARKKALLTYESSIISKSIISIFEQKIHNSTQ